MPQKKIFLLQEVIDDLLNPATSLVGPLIKLNYFGRLTKNDELIDFTSSEINGYKDVDLTVPDYRRAIARLMVDIQAYTNRHTTELPISMLDSPFNNAFRYIDVREGISTIEKMGKEMSDSNGEKHEFYNAIPLELMHIIQPAVSKLYKSNVRLVAVGAKLIGNGNIIIDIPSSIRTKLLEFVMKIVDTFGYDIEIENFDNKENNKTINTYMKTIINNNGDGNVTNTGSGDILHPTITISKNNLTELQSELGKLGIEQADINSISEIVQREVPNENAELGIESKSWVMNILEKSLNGVGKIATGVSAHLLAGLIKGYYGIS